MSKTMSQEELIKLIKRILKKDANLDFLLKLNRSELEVLVALIRDRVGQGEK